MCLILNIIYTYTHTQDHRTVPELNVLMHIKCLGTAWHIGISQLLIFLKVYAIKNIK